MLIRVTLFGANKIHTSSNKSPQARIRQVNAHKHDVTYLRLNLYTRKPLSK